MAEDPVEDVRRYLARDEGKEKEKFTASLEGKSSAELVALLKSRKKVGPGYKRSSGDSDSGSSPINSDQHEGDVVVRSDSDVNNNNNTSCVAKKLQVEETVISVTSTEGEVEMSRVETTYDEPLLLSSEENVTRQSIPDERSALWHAVHSGVIVTKEELEEVRQEMIMQERVLKALEKDNAELHVERRLLRAKLNEMEQKAVNVEAKYSILASAQTPHTHAVTQSRLPVAAYMVSAEEGHQHKHNQDELHIELEHQKTIVRELQLELELVRREKKDVERRLAALDANKIGEMELELRNLRVDLKRKDTEHDETVKDMARKIAWYVECQEFNRAQEDLLKEQQDTIHRLRARLHEAGALDDEGKSNKRLGRDARVKYLTRRVVELEEALNQKHPNSIAQLIRSCQPSVQDSKLFKQLNHRIKELEEALVEKDRCTEAAVTRLRVETDRMKIQYQEKIEKLEDELKMRLMHAQTRRVRELEKQLSEARQALREKAEEKQSSMAVEEKPLPADGWSKEKNDMALTLPEGSKSLTRATQAEISDNQADEVISLLRRENETLKNQLSQATQQDGSSSNSILVSSSLETKGKIFSSHVVSSLQAHIATLTAELEVYKRLLMESQESLRDSHTRWEERLLTARQEYQSQMQHIRQEHNNDIRRIQESHQKDMKIFAEEQQRNSHETSWACQKLSQISLEDPRQSRAFLQSVAERLGYLERRQVQKEREAAHQLAEVKRVADFELTLAKQKAEMLVEQKNQQIQEFRLQLDQLLGSLVLLQSHA